MYNILLVEFVVLTANKIIITKLAIDTRLRIVRRNAFWLINFKISVINSSSVNPPLFLTSTKDQTELISINSKRIEKYIEIEVSTIPVVANPFICFFCVSILSPLIWY